MENLKIRQLHFKPAYVSSTGIYLFPTTATYTVHETSILKLEIKVMTIVLVKLGLSRRQLKSI